MTISLDLYSDIPFEYEVTVTVTDTNMPLDLTGAYIVMKWRPTLESDTVTLDANTTNGYITLSDPVNGKFLIEPPLVATQGVTADQAFDILVITQDNKYYIIGRKGKIKYQLLNTRA